jgi:hypothetical protein
MNFNIYLDFRNMKNLIFNLINCFLQGIDSG